MKVAVITMQFPAPSETFASGDVRMLGAKGVDVSVYALKRRHKDHDTMMSERGLNDIPVKNCGLPEIFSGFFSMLLHPILFFRLAAWLFKNESNQLKHLIKLFFLMPQTFFIVSRLKNEKPDIIHLFWGHYPCMTGYLAKIVMPEVKLSMFLGAYDLEYGLSISAGTAETADCVFTHAYANLPQIKAAGIDADRVTVVHRGVDIDALKSVTDKAGTRRKGQWAAAGRLIKDKGFQHIIKLFIEHEKTDPDGRLVIVGDGPYADELKKMATGHNIVFTGHVSQNQVLQYMAESEVFLLLSFKKGERLPNAVKEAMLAGCIVFVSDTPGIDELVENGVNGFIVKNGDYSSIPSMLASVPAGMGRRAKETIVTGFSLDTSVDKYLEIWKGALNGR